MGFYHGAGLKLLSSSYLPTLASQSVGITGVSHGTRPVSSLSTPQPVLMCIHLLCIQASTEGSGHLQFEPEGREAGADNSVRGPGAESQLG